MTKTRHWVAAITGLTTLLAGAFPVQADTLETEHAIIEYEPQDAGIAQQAATAIDQVYVEMALFFSQVKPPMVFGKVPVILGDAQGAPGKTSVTGDHTIAIDPGHTDFASLDRLSTTVVHELFHYFAYRAGVVNFADLQVPHNYWVLEGTAEIAEYYFNTPNVHKQNRLITYLQASEYHQDVDIMRASHMAALFVYYLWQENPDSFRQIMQQFGQGADGHQVASAMAIQDHWYDFTKLMFNRAPIQPIQVDGATLAPVGGDPYSPVFAPPHDHEVPSQGVVTADITLPPLSWQHEMIRIPGDLEWFNIHFGELGEDENFIVHAYLKDRQSEQYRYEDWSGKKLRRICNQQTGPCENASLDDVSQIALIMANKSIDTDLSGKLVAGTLDQKWRLTEMQVSQTLIVPARGELTLEFGTEGGMLVRSFGWWLKFPGSHFPQGTSQLAYDYVNGSCRFPGYVKFERGEEEITWEEDELREKYIWPTRRVDKGGLLNTPSGWWCRIPGAAAVSAVIAASTAAVASAAAAAGASLAATASASAAASAAAAAPVAVPAMVGGIAGQAAMVATITRLNTREYPPDSFAGKLSGVMKAMMSLQVSESGMKDVIMYHEIPEDEPRRLRVELQGNVRAFFEPVPE